MEIYDTKSWKNNTNKTKNSLSDKFLSLITYVLNKNDYIKNKHKFIRILSTMCEYNIENECSDLIERFNLIVSLGKDSSSLNSYILRYGNNKGKEKFHEKCSKCKIDLNHFITKYGKIEGLIKYKEHKILLSHSLEGYIKRHGENEGPIMYRKYWDSTNFSTKKEAFIRRHGENKGIELYNIFIDNRKKYSSGLLFSVEKFNEIKNKRNNTLRSLKYNKNNTSLDSFISRYGKLEGNIKYNNYIKKCKLSNKLCKEYWKKMGYSDEECTLKVSEEQSNRNVKFSRASKSSLKCFIPVYKFIRKYLGIKKNQVYWGLGNSKEYYIRYSNGLYFYDFCIPDLKIIIEFNGSIFHVNNKNKLHPLLNYDKILFRDKNKEQVAKNNGFNYLIIWDYDDKNYNINKCKSFIKECINVNEKIKD